MKSKIYNGYVMHERKFPVLHKFTYPVIFFAININEIENLKKSIKGFSNSSKSFIKIDPNDYLYGKGAFADQLKKIYDNKDVNSIIVVTVLKFLIPTFNPVNFYFFLDKKEKPLKIIAEVNNTFKERHIYVLDGNNDFPFEGEHKKEFHVSPFNNMNGKYMFNFNYPGDNFNVKIKLYDDEECIIEAKLWGKGDLLTTSNLWRKIINHPFIIASTLPRIVYQAFLLKVKYKLKVFKKPISTHEMTIRKNNG